MSTESKRLVEVLTYETAREQGGSDCLSNDKRVAEDGEEFVSGADYAALQSQNAELVALLDQIHQAANKVYQMGDATCRNVLVNIYEISGKVAALAKVQP